MLVFVVVIVGIVGQSDITGVGAHIQIFRYSDIHIFKYSNIQMSMSVDK